MARARGRRPFQPVLYLAMGWIAMWIMDLRFVVQMILKSAQAELPELWVRPQAAVPPTCRALHGAPVPDLRAYKRDAAGVHVQTTQACEDVRMLRSLGLVIFSCDPGRRVWNTLLGPVAQPEFRGALWTLPYGGADDDGELTLLPIEHYPDAWDFHPLGVHAWEESEDRARLFVVNHREVATTIEVLDLARAADGAWRASYVRTLQHPLGTHAANSVAPLGRNAFLVTNTHITTRRAPPASQLHATLAGVYRAGVLAPLAANEWYAALQHVEDVVGTGFVSYVAFNDTPPAAEARHDAHPERHIETLGTEVHAHVVIHGLSFANGIGIAPNQRHVVVASTARAGVYYYSVAKSTVDRQPDWYAPGVLQHRMFVSLPFLPDNVDVVPPAAGAVPEPDDPFEGWSVITAGHPSALDLDQVVRAPDTEAHAAAPSWVAEITVTSERLPHPPVPPLAENKRMPAPPAGWLVGTLVQSNGSWISSSSGAAWDRSVRRGGTLAVTGLYGAAPLLCRGVFG